MQLFITGVGPAAVGATGEGVVGGGGGGAISITRPADTPLLIRGTKKESKVHTRRLLSSLVPRRSTHRGEDPEEW